MIETSSDLHLKSAAIFGNLKTFSENVRQRSCDLRTNFQKSSESGRFEKRKKSAVISVSI